MLIDIDTSLPPVMITQRYAADELKKRMGSRPAVERMIETASNYSGIDTRSVVVVSKDEKGLHHLYSSEEGPITPDTKTRMTEYEKWSGKLAVEAADKLLRNNNISPSEINRLITISCTGFSAPGMDYFLLQQLNIPCPAKRTNIGFMGCAASIIGFNLALEALNSTPPGKEMNILMVSVELCSLHLQTEPTRDNILSNIIFSDGCAAALFSNKDTYRNSHSMELLSTMSFLFGNSAGLMGWKIGNYGFEMLLSSDLPKIIFEQAVPALLNMLSSAGLSKDQIRHWALHPGGRAILDSLQTGLQLTDEQTFPSRQVLRKNGNMSSASILFVLKEIMNSGKVAIGDLICAVAFGPGLTMEVAILKG